MYKLITIVAVLCVFGAGYAQDDPPDTVDELDVELYLGRWYQMYCNLLVNITFQRDGYCVTADCVCLFTERGGVHQPLPGRQTPGQTPPQADTPQADTPPRQTPPRQTPPQQTPPGQTPPPEMATEADNGPINATYISVYNAQRVGGPDGALGDIFGYAFLPDPAEPGQLYVFLDGGNPDGGEYWIILLGPETFGDDGLYQYSVVTNSDRTSLFVLARDPETFRTDYNEEVLDFLANNGFDTPTTEPLETYQESDCQYAPAP